MAARTLPLPRVGPDWLVGYHHLNDVTATSPAHAFAVGSYRLRNRANVKDLGRADLDGHAAVGGRPLPKRTGPDGHRGL